MSEILRVEKLNKYYNRGFFRPKLKVLSDVSFVIKKGECFGLVGESGSGKTTVAKVIAGLTDYDSGQVEVGGKVQMVFQNPKASLNPRMRVTDIIKEPFHLAKINENMDRKISKLLESASLSSNLLSKYPHELSGGEQQRVAIARAIAVKPDLLILDEPLSSLDALIQFQVAQTFMDLQEEFELTCLFVTHNLGWAKKLCSEIAVMHQGRLKECRERDLNPHSLNGH